MSVAIVFVGQLRGHAATWADLNVSFHYHDVYVSMWRPLTDADAKCVCFESLLRVRVANWLRSEKRPTLATTLTSDQMNLESYAYSIYKGMQMVVDTSHATTASPSPRAAKRTAPTTASA